VDVPALLVGLPWGELVLNAVEMVASNFYFYDEVVENMDGVPNELKIEDERVGRSGEGNNGGKGKGRKRGEEGEKGYGVGDEERSDEI
jgi:hypothetical protein